MQEFAEWEKLKSKETVAEATGFFTVIRRPSDVTGATPFLSGHFLTSDFIEAQCLMGGPIVAPFASSFTALHFLSGDCE